MLDRSAKPAFVRSATPCRRGADGLKRRRHRLGDSGLARSMSGPVLPGPWSRTESNRPDLRARPERIARLPRRRAVATHRWRSARGLRRTMPQPEAGSRPWIWSPGPRMWSSRRRHRAATAFTRAAQSTAGRPVRRLWRSARDNPYPHRCWPRPRPRFSPYRLRVPGRLDPHDRRHGAQDRAELAVHALMYSKLGRALRGPDGQRRAVEREAAIRPQSSASSRPSPVADQGQPPPPPGAGWPGISSPCCSIAGLDRDAAAGTSATARGDLRRVRPIHTNRH